MNPHSLLDYIFFNDMFMQIHSECVCLFMHVKAQAMINKHEILIVEMNVLCEENVFCERCDTSRRLVTSFEVNIIHRV